MRAEGGEQARRPKRLIVCADDYAFTPAISRGIRELLAIGGISATSVMAASRYWPEEAPALRAVAAGKDVGLHVTLTDQEPLGPLPSLAPGGRFPPLPALIKAALARRLPLAEIEAEAERQLARFVEHFGMAPAHVDGHHHVQQLPGIRDIVVRLAQRLGPGRVWVRNAVERRSLLVKRGVAIPKALLIGAFGRGIRRRLRAAGVGSNNGFSGVYDFATEKRPAAELFARFLTGAGDNALIMCHPGYADATLAALDWVTTQRDDELTFLASAKWRQHVASAGYEIGPFRHAAATVTAS